MSKNKVKVAWLITDQHITVNYDGQTHIVPRGGKLAEQLVTAVKENKLEEIPTLVSASARIETFSKGSFTVRDGEILIEGVPAPKVLGNKIVRFSEEGLPFEPLLKFAKNLQQNPSYRAVNELFQFLEKNNHPITENGNFIAYKKVRSDFMDLYTGTFDNSVGNTVEMPRNQVDEDAQQTCSNGLHVANWHYAHDCYGSHNDTMLEVEVNPADVVAVPVDYDNAKMRVCKYKVLAVVNQEHSSDTSLRITNSSKTEFIHEDDSSEPASCEDCGVDIEPCFSICEDCYEAEQEEADRLYNEGFQDDFYGSSSDDEDTDEYPWEDELD